MIGLKQATTLMALALRVQNKLMSKNVRALAARCTFAVVDQGRSLGDELPKQQQLAAAKDKGLLQELCYGVLRHLPELENQVRQFVSKPLKGKQRVLHFLMLVGVYQLKYTRIPDHAAVGETVAAAPILKGGALKGMINGVLRNVQRNDEKKQDEQLSDPVRYNHPGWFINKIKAGYPEHWQQILDANMQRSPMWLRVNQRKTTTKDYLASLTQANISIANVDDNTGAIELESPIDVNLLPNFEAGFVSVQDGAAQHAAPLLKAQPNERILDCCAAPGGKTCHVLETSPDISEMVAIDVDRARLARVADNIERLELNAQLIAADASDPSKWWDGQLFDRILLDAPCSGTGVIRRHPDIKWLRRASDIEELVELQQKIVDAMWQLLKPGGTMVYATCSILPQENSEQIKSFIARTDDAILEPTLLNGTDLGKSALAPSEFGWQILPGERNMDGFYYAVLTKQK